MKEQIRIIAERLKGLREIAGLPAESVAKDLDVPAELYLGYESGSVDIPVGVLYKAAHRYNIDLTAILSGENPRLHVYCLVRKGKGLSVERRKQYKYESLAYNFIHKKSEPFLVRIDPTPAGTPVEFNSHPGQEFDYVIEGTMEITIDNHSVIMNPGDSIYFDSGYPHGMRAVADAPVTMIAVIV